MIGMSIDLRRNPMVLIIASKDRNTDSKATIADGDDVPKIVFHAEGVLDAYSRI